MDRTGTLTVMTVSSHDAGPRQISRTVEVDRPVAELFDLVADPHRHGELDGSGTVGATVKGPTRVSAGDRFSVNMRMYGLPYRITSRVTGFEDDRLVEWRHPLGHRWRWEFEPLGAARTRVTETFDYSRIDPVRAKFLELTGMTKQNAAGIEKTLTRLAGH